MCTASLDNILSIVYVQIINSINIIFYYNFSGFLDVEEVKNWVIPPDFDHAEAEARHLIYEADGDADEQLSKDEIMSKYDLFVGSQATDFGDALARHDEF